MPNYQSAADLLEAMSEAETDHLASRYKLASPDEIRAMRRLTDYRSSNIPLAPAEHGSRSKYAAGCRCTDCKQAEHIYQRARYAQTKGTRT